MILLLLLLLLLVVVLVMMMMMMVLIIIIIIIIRGESRNRGANGHTRAVPISDKLREENSLPR